jgi:Bacterial Ig domain/PASTA domain
MSAARRQGRRTAGKRVFSCAVAAFVLAACGLLSSGALAAAAAAAPPPKLYWTDANWFGTAAARVSSMNVDGTEVQPLVAPGGVNHAFITATPSAGGAIYWADSWNAGVDPSIRRANLDGTDPTTVVSGIYCAFGVEVDPVGRKLYWTCTDDRVMRSNLDGTAMETVLTVAGAPLVASPQGIALDVANRTMYFANTAVGKIQRANFDGTMLTDLVTGLSSPHDVALDLTARKLYWTAGASISRANLDGSVQQPVVTGLQYPTGLALDTEAGKLYWTSREPGRIGRANLDGGTPGTLLATGLDVPWGIAVLTDRPPQAAGDALSVAEDDSGGVPVLLNDSDDDGDALSVAESSDPAHGDASCGADGACSYRPDHDFNGVDSFTYTASDGRGGTDTGTVTVEVRPRNDAPVALDADFSVSGSVPAEISLPATDVDRDQLGFEIVGAPAHAALASLGGSRVRYTAARGYVGPDSFTFRVSDGTAYSNTATVRVSVERPPAPPPQTRCVVPNLRGRTVAQARRMLAARRCALGRVARAYSARLRSGRIISQSRRPGARLPRGTRVKVVVSRGRRRR